MQTSERTRYRSTFVIFSMFLTDLRRSSISRRVAMFLVAPIAGAFERRAKVDRASMVVSTELLLSALRTLKCLLVTQHYSF